MISLKELNSHAYPTTPEIDNNLNTLLERINKIREAWGKPMTITSGLRSQADQQRINPKAPKSNHLIGAAVDIEDKDGSLAQWNQDNVKLLESVGLWCEHPDNTPGWEHYQIYPPKSGNRFFHP